MAIMRAASGAGPTARAAAGLAFTVDGSIAAPLRVSARRYFSSSVFQ
jgi:hypothetical protein